MDGPGMSNIFETAMCVCVCVGVVCVIGSKVRVFADFDWSQFKDSEKMEKLKLLGQIG